MIENGLHSIKSYNNNHTETSSNTYTSLELTRENNIKRNNEFLYQLFGKDNNNTNNNNNVNINNTTITNNIQFNHKESKEEQEKREINNIIQKLNYINQQKLLLKKKYLYRDNEINEILGYLSQVE